MFTTGVLCTVRGTEVYLVDYIMKSMTNYSPNHP